MVIATGEVGRRVLGTPRLGIVGLDETVVGFAALGKEVGRLVGCLAMAAIGALTGPSVGFSVTTTAATEGAFVGSSDTAVTVTEGDNDEANTTLEGTSVGVDDSTVGCEVG